MKRLKAKSYILYTAIILVGIFADQLTKWLAVKFLKSIDTFPIIKRVLHLTYVENRGAAFGILADARWVFIAVSSITIFGLIGYIYLGYTEKPLYTISISMIISGGIGNMIDRLMLGYVVDFIDFRLINFAVFNGADSFVCIGSGLLILALILDIAADVKKEKQGKRQ